MSFGEISLSTPAEAATTPLAAARLAPTACLMFADGEPIYGVGFGGVGVAAGELCFNTAMTGYQEILTDPSYAGQIIVFTFPHIGNVGVNLDDEETTEPVALGMIARHPPTPPSNWRAETDLGDWLAARGRIGLAGVDTRRLTRKIRDLGAPNVVVAHNPDGVFDLDGLRATLAGFDGIAGADLAAGVSTPARFDWAASRWSWPDGHGTPAPRAADAPRRRVVAIDYGAKRNILRCLTDAGCEVTVLPATATAADVLSLSPEGVFLSNGPGDPAATGAYATDMIRGVVAAELPVFGICLGHQMLGLALGAQTTKMKHGHHGANHPVKDLETGKVEITSMNHGFAVDAATLPDGVVETHRSLFDGSNCGLRVLDRPIFSVQHHPEASPGPMDSFYLFERFVAAMDARAA